MIRYRYSDGTIKEFEDRETFFDWVERMDSDLARDLRIFGVAFYYDMYPQTELFGFIANGDFESTTQRDFLNMGLDALSEDLHNGREKDDWLFGKLMMDKED